MNHTFGKASMRNFYSTQPVKEIIENATKTINKFYKTPDITIKVEPCGASNAYAKRDITICSELVSELSVGYPYALNAIVFHELSHVLLKFWNLPGYDNEDIADEFALALLGKYDRESITSFIEWMEKKDSTKEALYQILVGDKHSISIQRARNLKNGLSHIDDIMDRWGNMLHPYDLPQNY